jgi:ComF family protein
MQLFTPTCQYCKKRVSTHTEIFCIACYGLLPLTQAQFSKENIVVNHLRKSMPLGYGGSYLYYLQNPMVKELIDNIKYYDNKELGIYLGKEMARNALQDYRDEIDIILPLPLHTSKLLARGYNQSLLLAEGIRDIIDKPIIDENIVRIRNTQSQTLLSKSSRLENVKDAFVVKDSSIFQNKKILLVDDVVTTGASLSAAGRPILASACKQLSIFTLATAFDL